MNGRAAMGLLVVFSCGAAVGAAETPDSTILKAGAITARLNPDDGRMVSLAVGGHELLAEPGQLLLQIGQNEPLPLGKNLQGLVVSRSAGGLMIEGRERKSGVAVHAQWLCRKDLECRLTLTGPGPQRLEVAVELRLPCTRRRLQFLAPSGDDHVEVDFSRPWPSLIAATPGGWSCRPAFSIGPKTIGG